MCLSGTLEDKLAASSAARFHGVEIFDNDLVASPWSPTRIREECERRGLSIDAYQPFRDFEAVPPDMFAANLRRAERTFDILEQLGTQTLLVSSSVPRDAVDDDDLAAEQLHALVGRAHRRGLRVAYEALAWGRFVNTYAHAWRIVRRADHPALGLCLDSFHVLSRDDPAGIRVLPGGKVFHVQVADAPRLNMDAVECWSPGRSEGARQVGAHRHPALPQSRRGRRNAGPRPYGRSVRDSRAPRVRTRGSRPTTFSETGPLHGDSSPLPSTLEDTPRSATHVTSVSHSRAMQRKGHHHEHD